VLHLTVVFTKRDRTARLLGVANLVFQHLRGLATLQIAERIGMNARSYAVTAKLSQARRTLIAVHAG
jgi:hypothetical protein